MLKRSVGPLALIVLLTVAVISQETTTGKKVKAKAITIEGYVVDAACAKDMAGKADVMDRAAAHTKKCALEESCAPSGFGVFSGGTYYKFDAAGDRKALALIEKTKREKEILVDVKGIRDGDTFKLVSIKETKIQKEKKGNPKSEPKMD